MIFAAVAAEASTGTFTGQMDHVAQGFEVLGAAILVVGVVWSFVLATSQICTSRELSAPLHRCGAPCGVR